MLQCNVSKDLCWMQYGKLRVSSSPPHQLCEVEGVGASCSLVENRERDAPTTIVLPLIVGLPDY
jgi:hypothetical protein